MLLMRNTYPGTGWRGRTSAVELHLPLRPVLPRRAPVSLRARLARGALALGEIRGKLAELARVVTRTPGGSLVERLAHLPDARRLYAARPPAEVEAGLVPVESAECEQPLRGGPRVANQLIVVELENRFAAERLPVRHQPAVLSEVMADVHQ